MKLIVEMGMPICCADCPCCICLNGMKPAYCKAVMVDDDNIVDGLMWRETDPNERPSWCPIKGVLPDEHGDLIDRDKFVDKYIRHYTEQERKMNLVFAAVEVKQDFADMIYEEDAVIAAESEADADYQASVLMQEYFERYEPTYNSEDGSM